jgi:hypothetical protein
MQKVIIKPYVFKAALVDIPCHAYAHTIARGNNLPVLIDVAVKPSYLAINFFPSCRIISE